MSIAHTISLKILLAGFFILAVFAAYNWEQWDGRFLAVVLFLIAFLVAFALAAGEHIVLPMKKFLRKAEHLGNGDFAGRFFVQSKDEMGHLGHVFDKIAQNLGQNKFEVRKLQEAFDLRVKHITELMGETIHALEEKVKNRTTELRKIAQDFQVLKEQVSLRDEEIAALKNKLKKGKKTKKRAGIT